MNFTSHKHSHRRSVWNRKSNWPSVCYSWWTVEIFRPASQIEFFLLSQNKKTFFFLRRSGPSVTVFQKPSFFIAITFHVKFNNTSKMSNALRKKQWTIMWLGFQLTVTEIVFSSKYQMDIVNVRLSIVVWSAQFVDGLVTRKIKHAIQFTIMFWMRNEFKVSVRCQV